MEHKIKTQYTVFMDILTDVRTRFLDDQNVCIRPDSMASGTSLRVECHVIFHTVREFFEWIGITEDMNKRAFLIDDRNQVRAGTTQAVRLMGSMQTSNCDGVGPIRVFVGRSSRPHGPAYEGGRPDGIEGTKSESVGGKASCIAYASSVVDISANTFESTPCLCTGRTGSLTEDVLNDTFSVSWRALKPAHLKQFAVTPTYTDGVQLGEVTIRYP